MARTITLASLGLLATLAGCYEHTEPPPPTGPCAFWPTNPDGVRTNRPTARFTRLGGALELRHFWVRRTVGATVDERHQAFGEVENTSDVVVCEGAGTLLVDGLAFRLVTLWAPAYDDGGDASVACLGPGERGFFEAAGEGPLPGDFAPEYSRVEYEFGSLPRPDAVPHPLARELVDVTWRDDDPDSFGAQATLRMRAEGVVADLQLDLLGRDSCGLVWRMAQAAIPLGTPPAFAIEAEADVDTSALAEIELLPFVRFRAP